VEGTAFINLVDEKDYVFDEENDAMSEYERNFRSEGKPIYRLIYKK
jgi:tRNA G46 methylase TrmB